MEEFKYPGVLFMSDGRRSGRSTDRLVQHLLYWSVVVKRAEPKGKALFTGQSLFQPSPVVTNCR